MKYTKYLTKLRFGLVFAVSIGLIAAGYIQHLSAASGQLYVSPGSASVQKGSTKTFQIRVHPSTPADSVSATLAYDQSKLQFVSVSGGGSPFTIELANSGGNGTVNVQRGILGSTVSTDVLVASVTFKALVGGSATAKLDLNGYTLSGGSQNNPSVIDGSVTLTSPTTSTPKPGTGTTTPPTSGDDGGSDDSDNDGGSSDGGDSTEEKPKDNKDQASKPDIKLKRREFRKLVVSIASKQKVRAYIVFGTDQEQLKASTSMTGFGTSHDVSLPESLLIPGTTFYYKVITVDQKGTKTESEVQNTKTKGYTVRILILDKLDRRLRERKVKLFSEPMETETDENGYATFADVAPGKHHIEYEQNGETHSAQISVQEDRITTAPDGTQSADRQEATAQLGSVEFAAARSLPIVPAAVAAALLLALVGGYIVMKRRNSNVFAKATNSSAQPVIQPPVHTVSGDSNQLIDKATGVNKPEPGSLVGPNHDKDDNKE